MNLFLDNKPTISRRIPYSFGLIGYPLGHSLSPQIHLAALHALDLNGEYNLYPVLPFPDGQNELKSLLTGVRVGKIHGLNVTIPHKQNIIPLLDTLTPAAETIGAVNTIFLDDGKLVGDNTDALGFWVDLDTNLNVQRFNNSEVLVLGAGGSARAVVYALLTHGFHVTIAARRTKQAQELKEHFTKAADIFPQPVPELHQTGRKIPSPSIGNKSSITVINLQTLINKPYISTPFSLIVNTTPVGMSPHTDASPWPQEIPYPAKAAFYDLVYNPRKTLLVSSARAAGHHAHSGLGMLVEQAALAFERWTARPAPRDIMLSAVNV
jgi:shikimate dehydrogenase